MVELAVLCADLDKDNDGCIGLLELSNGYETPEFRTLMEHVDIKKDEMEQIFRVLDEDKDGSLSYLNFCQKVGGFFKRDPLMMQSIIQVPKPAEPSRLSRCGYHALLWFQLSF